MTDLLIPGFGATLIMPNCNIYGAENDGGAKRVLGGIGPQTPDRQWYCEFKSIGRYRMTCEHGHTGQVMPLCAKHVKQYKGQVHFCPRCNTNDATAHKCNLNLTEVS